METRILLARMPRILHDVLSEMIRSQSDMRLVGEVEENHRLAAAIRGSAPHVVVMGAEREESPGLCHSILRRFPDVKVLALEGHGRRLSLYEMRPVYTPLGEASPARLLAWIRQAARPAAPDAESTDGQGRPATRERDLDPDPDGRVP